MAAGTYMVVKVTIILIILFFMAEGRPRDHLRQNVAKQPSSMNKCYAKRVLRNMPTVLELTNA